ncbi:MAG: hypothetical protein J6A36_03645 [Clostridia bacterium]|nr:hypothetical protein [Clostridia bacterium]
MLPKIWKKLLLAICIIACLFNITVKLVNRISLEKVIASQQEGVNVKELLNITDEQPVVTKPVNSVTNYNVVETAPVVEQTEEQVNVEENIEEENINNEEVSENTEEQEENFMDRMFNSSGFSELMGN